MNKNIIMYPHGGSGNRGCEAIVRGTNKLLDLKTSVLFSSRIEEDKKVNLDKVCTIKNESLKFKKYSIKFIGAYIQYHILKNKHAFDILTFRNIFDNCNKNTISLSIGGDNYCYGEANYIYLINREVKRKGAKTVLWGCSVDEKQITSEMMKDLKTYDLIVARESITYDSMKKINHNTILYSDPAFQLDKVDLPLPEHFIENNTVGINVSPLIMSCESSDGITRENYIQLIDYILNHTDMNIALIPHVVWENNDDRKPLKELYDMFKDTNRVCLIDDHNCMELKGYISRCRFFVGARTHATIAAYSTCVPTLVVGYSVKAKGIAKDIFGTYDDYVLPVQSLKEKDDLTKSFKWLIENENDIKNHLNDFIPGYKEKALELKEIIEKL